mgnify:CR=1 FL=1
MTVDIATLLIQVDTLEVRIAANNLVHMQQACTRAAEETSALEKVTEKYTKALSSLGIANDIGQIVKMSDAYTKFTAQLRMATGTTQEYGEAYDNVKRIAATGQTELAATAGMYTKITDATEKLGINQAQVANITEALNLGVRISGASAEESATAIEALSDSFVNGAMSSREFNAINQSAPEVMAALAAGMGVPEEALAALAATGKISADVMAIALPNALGDLRKESKKFDTIGGAFTVFSNNVLEFTGQMVESTGAVSVLTGGLNFLSNNLTLVVGLLETLTAVKFVNWASTAVKGIYAKVTANRAMHASTLAVASADVAATGAASTLAAARVAELQATIRTSQADVALALTTNGLIPAQARAAIAAEAHAAALMAQMAAMRAASVAGGVLRGALAFLGGPIGLIVTALGIGATAWGMWGKSSSDASRLASEESEQSMSRIISNLEKQNVKIREQIVLARKESPQLANVESPAAQEAAAVLSRLNALRSRSTPLSNVDQVMVANLSGMYKQLTGVMKENLSVKAELDVVTQKRSTSEWMSEYATTAEKMAARLALVGKSYKDGVIPPDLYKRIQESFGVQDDGGKRVASALDESTKAANGFIESLRNETAQVGLSVDQMRMMTAARAAAKAPNAELRMEIMATALANDIALKSWENLEDARKSSEAETQKLTDERNTSYAAVVAELAANKEAITTYGLSKVQIQALTLARDEERLSQRETLKLSKEELTHLERMIGGRKANVAALNDLHAREKETKDAEERLEEQKKLWNSIDSAAHGAFVSIFDAGKSAFDGLRSTLKNGLLDMLYQMTVKKWVLNVGASISAASATGMASADGLGIASGTIDGGIGGIASLMQSAKTAYTIATAGFATLTTGMGTSVVSMGTLFGSTAIEAFGAGLGSTGLVGTADAAGLYAASGGLGSASAVTAGAYAGAAITAAAGIAAGILGGKMISGQYGSGSTVMVGTGAGAVAGAIIAGPIGAAIGGALGGVVGGIGNRIFGMGDKKYGDTGIDGILSGTEFSGTEYAKWTQKGGWLRSNKKGTDLETVDATMSAAFVETYAAIRNVSASLANVFGIDTSSLATRTQALHINLTGLATEADRLGAVTKFFEGVGNAIAVELLPNIGEFKVGNEELSTTLQRVAGNYSGIDAALQLIGRTSQDAFGAVGVATIGARENLVKLAGSLDAFTSGTSFFAENFLTEAEQMAPLLSTVADTLDKLGLAGVKTVDQYKGVVLGLNLASTADQELYIKLLALAPAFKTASEYSNQLAAATGNFSAVSKTASDIASERRDMQQQLNQLTQSEAQLLASQRAGIAEGNRGLFDQIQAVKAVTSAKDALAKAYETESAAAKSALEKSKSWVTTLNGLNSSMALGAQSTLTPEQKYAEARAQFEKTLAAANAGDATAQSGLSAAEQAFLTASQVVNASDARYAADYARVVEANKEALKWAAAQVDVQQASLDALNAQVSGLITINDSVLTVAQAIAGLRAAMGGAADLGVKFSNPPVVAALAAMTSPVTAAVFDPVRYSSAANVGSEVLVAEIRGLREDNQAMRVELEGLRADQRAQTGATIQATFESNANAARTVVDGVDKSSRASAWATAVKGEYA